MNPQQYYGGQFETGSIQPPIKKKFPSRRNILIIAFVFLVGLALVAGIISATSQDPVDKFIGKAIKGDAQGSYSLLGPEAKDTYTESAWATEVKELSESYTSYSLDSKSSENDESGNGVTSYRFDLMARDPEASGVAWVVVETMRSDKGKSEISDYLFYSLK